MSSTRYAIVVAGGSGLRMGSKIPKQFLEMKGRPILMHTLEAFYKCSPRIKLILVLPEAHIKLWKTLVKDHQFTVPHQIRKGGASRFQSVKHGLGAIHDSGLVAIHDGVRPVITSKIIDKSFQVAQEKGSAITCIDLRDSLRKITTEASISQDRNQFKLVQTPQTFDIDLIKQAYELPEEEQFTDDASVWESSGQQVSLIDGSHENIKITTVQDLVLAEVLMKFI